MPLVNFSEREIGLLKEMARAYHDGKLNVPRRPTMDESSFSERQDYLAPEVYIAQVQYTGTSDDETEAILPQTETDSYDQPTGGTIELFRLLTDGSYPELYPVASIEDWYGYNISEFTIHARRNGRDVYFPVIRDKFGKWIPLPTYPVRMAWATLTGTAAVETTDTTFEVSSITPFEGYTWTGPDPLTVQNSPDEFAIPAGATGKIIYCKDTVGWRWHPLDFPCE